MTYVLRCESSEEWAFLEAVRGGYRLRKSGKKRNAPRDPVDYIQGWDDATAWVDAIEGEERRAADGAR